MNGPIDDYVIARAEEIAEAEGQPIMANGPIFEWSPGVPIIDDNEDEEELNAPMADLECGYHNNSNVEEDNTDDSEESDDNDEDEPVDQNRWTHGYSIRQRYR